MQKLLNGTAEYPVEACLEFERLGKAIAKARGEKVNYKGSTCDCPPEAVQYYYRYTAQLAPSYYGDWEYTRKLQCFDAPLLVVYGEEDSLAVSS